MSLEILHGEIREYARALNSSASEAATATLAEIAGCVTASMPGADAGATMQTAASDFDRDLRGFVDAMNSDEDAALRADAGFDNVDEYGAYLFGDTAWNDVDPAINYGGRN